MSEARIDTRIRNERTTKALRKKIEPALLIQRHGYGSDLARRAFLHRGNHNRQKGSDLNI